MSGGYVLANIIGVLPGVLLLGLCIGRHGIGSGMGWLGGLCGMGAGMGVAFLTLWLEHLIICKREGLTP